MRQTWGAAQTRLLVVVAALVALLGGAAPASAAHVSAQGPTTSSTPYASAQPGSALARAAGAVRTALRGASSSTHVTTGPALEVASAAGPPGEWADAAAPVGLGAPRLLLVQLPRPPDTRRHGAQQSGPTGRAPPAPAET